MLIFLDTEFTDFVGPVLISIALVSEDGREFYAERTDYPQNECSQFVCETVLPLLGQVPGAACNRIELACRLRAWFEALPEPTTVVYDFELDWILMVDAFLGPNHSQPPDNVGEKLALSQHTITHPVFDQALNRTFTLDFPQHHALADARALMAGYLALRNWGRAINRHDIDHAVFKLADYLVLAELAHKRTSATLLDGRTCRSIYKKALTGIDLGIVTATERQLLDALGVLVKVKTEKGKQ
jgi:hypothetical protein